MKPPHCPSCGKSHWSTQRCSARESRALTEARKVAEKEIYSSVDLPERPAEVIKTPTGSPPADAGETATRRMCEGAAENQLQGSASGIVTPGQDQSGKSVGVAPGPLTNAQRQKKHREKRGHAYREANKLRMRKTRDGH